MRDPHTRHPSSRVHRGSTLEEMLTFGIVGGVTASCYIILAGVLHYFGMSPTVSSAAAYALCVPLGYIGHRSFTFRSRHPHRVTAIAYLAVQGVALLVAAVTTFLSTVILGQTPMLDFVLSAVAAASVSFCMQKHWVF